VLAANYLDLSGVIFARLRVDKPAANKFGAARKGRQGHAQMVSGNQPLDVQPSTGVDANKLSRVGGDNAAGIFPLYSDNENLQAQSTSRVAITPCKNTAALCRDPIALRLSERQRF
jgi:hypothetical protein